MTNFNFPKVTLNTIDWSDAEMDKLQNQRAFIGPGEHSLKIVKMENKGPNKNDSTFINVSITFEAPNGAQKWENLQIPTVRLKFNGANGKKGELMPFQK